MLYSGSSHDYSEDVNGRGKEILLTIIAGGEKLQEA